MRLRPLTGLAAALMAACALTACSGGGGGSSSTPTQSPPSIAEADAARFLTQSTMGVTSSDITTVQSQGYAQWISQQEGTNAATSAKSFMASRLSTLQAANPKATVGPPRSANTSTLRR